MASILLIDDRAFERNRIADHLRKNGHVVSCVNGIRTEDLYLETQKWLEMNGGKIDFLVLDMKFSKDTLGGIQLYAKLEAEGFHLRFRHLLILTQLYTVGTEEDLEKIEEFLVGRNYPAANLIKHEQNLTQLLERIETLVDG